MWKAVKWILAIALGVFVFQLVPWGAIFGVLLGLITFFVAFAIIGRVLERIMDKDAAYIRESLKMARRKNREIQVYGRKLKLWKLWRKIRYMRKINTQIIDTIHAHPNRFGQAEKFFSLYLDSAVNVLEKYDVIVHQPVRTPGVQEALRKTEVMIDDLIRGLESELTSVLKSDMIDLEIEKEVLAKHGSPVQVKVEEEEEPKGKDE